MFFFSQNMESKISDPYRFSQATLEDTQEDELNAILGELSALQMSLDEDLVKTANNTATSSVNNGQFSSSEVTMNKMNPPHLLSSEKSSQVTHHSNDNG